MKKYLDKAGLAEFAQDLTNKYHTLFSSPLVAATATAMTDESKVYVYTGSETGYTAGNWYYYDGSSWTSGGVYNAVAVDTDTTLSVSGKAADAKAVGDKFDEVAAELEEKANIDGAYETMTVGNAEQLVSTLYVEDEQPYIFRAAGGSLEIGDREYDTLVGGTVVWNQLCQDLTQAVTGVGITCTPNSDGSVTLSGITDASSGDIVLGKINFISGHKYCIKEFSAANKYCVFYGFFYRKSADYDSLRIVSAASTVSGSWGFSICANEVPVSAKVTFTCIDLTQMLGSAIAEYVYTLETATAGSGIAWLKANGFDFGSYITYNTGQLVSVSDLASHKMVGFNAYDHSAGKAKVKGGNLYQITGTYTAVSLNGVTITPDANGKFTPSADGELTVTGGNSTDTCVHLVYDGTRDGEYEAYEAHTYALDSDLTLRGIPKLDSANNIYYDGDTYEADGTVTRKFEARAYQAGDESLTDAITDGTNTVVKLATPTTETADAFQYPQIVDNWGTEEYISTASLRIPVGHVTRYPANLKDKLEAAPDAPASDGDYYLQRENGINQYVPLVLPTRLPTMPAIDGTYKLVCTVADGTAALTWEEVTA